jgi:hypothetical protein
MATTIPVSSSDPAAASRERRFPSPSAQMRSGEQWRVRLGLIAATLLTIVATASFLRAIPG